MELYNTLKDTQRMLMSKSLALTSDIIELEENGSCSDNYIIRIKEQQINAIDKHIREIDNLLFELYV